MKHSSVNGLVNEQTVQDLYDMLLEKSRKYLDVQPSMPAAGSVQTKGRENFYSQRQSTGKNSIENTCFFFGSADHWMKDCPRRSMQPAGSTGQSSNSGAKNQPVKYQPKPTTGQKGKSKGKGRGKGDPKKKAPTFSSGGKNRPAARAIEGEEEEVPEYETENQEYEEFSEQPLDPFEPQEEEEQNYQEEAQPTETIKMILATMENFVLESQAERKALASIKALQNDDSNQVSPIVCRTGVL